MLKRVFYWLIHITDSAFEFQLVRRGIPPEALKRRNIMPTVLEDLKQQLVLARRRFGQDSLVVQSLEIQIDTYEKPQQSARELYLMGGRGRFPKQPIDGKKD